MGINTKHLGQVYLNDFMDGIRFTIEDTLRTNDDPRRIAEMVAFGILTMMDGISSIYPHGPIYLFCNDIELEGPGYLHDLLYKDK